MRLIARPELVADICFVVSGIMLMSLPARSWTNLQSLVFGIIFFLWANAHGTFLLGLIMLGFWYGQLLLFEWRKLVSSRDFRWMLPGVAAVIGCALNPFGFYRFIEPFRLHSLPWGQGTSLEMSPVTSGASLLVLTWTAGALLIVLIRLRERKYYWMFGMLLFLHYMAFCNIRYTLFIGLSFLVVAWDNVKHPRKTSLPSVLPLIFIAVRMFCYLCLVLAFVSAVRSLISSRTSMIQDYVKNLYPKSRVLLLSSISWMKEHPGQDYNLLSYHLEGSLAQMPETPGIHPLIDSGTHRYSDRTNQLYFYTLASPKTFELMLSQLHINAVAINYFTYSWASVLNGNPDWQLVQVDDDSQLYLRQPNADMEKERALFSKWEKMSLARLDKPSDVSSFTILRGLKLRPDKDSLRLLTDTTDTMWALDPQVVYLGNWLNQVRDDQIGEALSSIKDKTDSSSMGLRILLLLRLHRDQEAVDVARTFHPGRFSMGYQELEMLRADAFLRSGDLKEARAILDSFWPKPRYSLRWARLCQEVYAKDPQAMPANARLFMELVNQFDWQKATIEALNQNIERLSPASPNPSH